jgi:hypothetical protein
MIPELNFKQKCDAGIGNSSIEYLTVAIEQEW